MEKEKFLTYKERMKNREKLISEINPILKNVRKLDEEIKNLETELKEKHKEKD
jgi:hypothetical protein